jgi:thioredoxin 1
MSTTLIIILGFVVLFIAYLVYNFYKMKNMPPVKNHERIRILTNKNFKQQIKSGLFLIDFWAPWCAPCKMIAPTLNEISEKEQNVTIAKVNVDNQQQLAQKFKIRNIPTLIMTHNGKEIKRFTGVKTKKFLMKEVNQFLDTK